MTVFLRFLLNFRGVRTSEIMLTPTREHYFRKMAVFVFGPHVGEIYGDFTTVLDPQSQPKHFRKRFRENLVFRSPFLVVFHDLGTPLGTLLAPQITPKHCRDAPGQHLGRSEASGVDFGTSGGGFGSLRGRFWSLRG